MYANNHFNAHQGVNYHGIFKKEIYILNIFLTIYSVTKKHF